MTSQTGPLAGRHALVTGAGSGLGAAIARRLAQDGARVTLAGRRAEPLRALAQEIGPDRALAAPGFDVTDAEAVERGIEAARAAFGPIDALVNNAGAAETAPFGKTTRASWDRVIAVDLTSVFIVTQAALGDILAAGARGRIVNVASTAGLIGYRYVSAYCAAKHGVVGLTRALALELARTGATANALCPGYADTPLVREALTAIMAKTGRSEAEAMAELTAGNPQRRLVKPEEVAGAAAFLLTDEAASINGQAIAIAGGEVMTG